MIIQGKTEFGEVQYYFKVALQPNLPESTFAMVSIYSAPDTDLLASSCQTLWSCMYQGNDNLKVISIKLIQAVVAIVPHPHVADEELTRKLQGRVYVGEQMGLDVMSMAGIVNDPAVEVD